MVWFHMALRKTPLTMSQAPARTKQASTSHTFPATPAAAIARPHPAAASTTIRPCRCTRDVHPLLTLTSSEPAGIAAYISPSDHAASSSSARNGSTASGMASSIAATSTAYVPSSSLRLHAYRAPSAIAAQDGLRASCEAGEETSPATRATEAAKVTRSTAYAQPRPAYATTTPASAGPAMPPTCQRSAFSEAAAGRCSWATIRGIRESRAGRWTAPSAEVNAAITYSGHTAGPGSSALTSRAAHSTP